MILDATGGGGGASLALIPSQTSLFLARVVSKEPFIYRGSRAVNRIALQETNSGGWGKSCYLDALRGCVCLSSPAAPLSIAFASLLLNFPGGRNSEHSSGSSLSPAPPAFAAPGRGKL